MTPQDLLYSVLAICAFTLTIFLAWALYYLIQIFREAHRCIAETHKKIEVLDEFLRTLLQKITSSAVVLTAAAKGISELFGILKTKRAEKKKTKQE